MVILLINTATPEPVVTLAIDGNTYEQKLIADRTIGTQLLSAIEALLEKAGRKKQQLDRIAVHTGPPAGSLMSLRTGIATAQALASALPCSLVGVQGETEAEVLEQAATNNPTNGISATYSKER